MNLKVRVNADKTGVELKGLKMSMNPFCEIAIEEAVRMKEKGHIKEVTAMSIGDKSAADSLRQALALGADNAIHIMTDMRIDRDLQPLAVAKIFNKIFSDKKFDMVLLGKQVGFFVINFLPVD